MLADNGYVPTTVNAVIAKWSGPNQALVGTQAQRRLYLKASVFSAV